MVDKLKEAYQQKMEARFRLWASEIAKLKARAQLLEADARIDHQKRLQELERKYDQALRHFDDLKAAGAGKWKQLQSTVSAAADTVDEAFRSWYEKAR